MKKIVFVLVGVFFCLASFSKIVIYPAPKEEPVSVDFSVSINKKQIFVYQARVSAIPVNQVWPGYQRPLEQTELASFCYFDTDEEVEIEIKSTMDIRKVVIRPLSYGIQPSIKRKTIKFKIKKSCQLVVEINDWHKALHIFANPVEAFKVNIKDPNIHYFGPGIHDAGIINLKSNETVFIDGGAIVYGVINSDNAKNIRIIGRGILDASKIERSKAPSMITLRRIVNAYISGIILRDPHGWTVVPTSCDSITINNIKLVGLWRYNADGIDIVNSSHIRIENSFVRAFDDCIVLKGLNRSRSVGTGSSFSDILVNNCVIWNDWGRALEIGAETVADSIHDVIFRNCDIIHYVHIAMDIQNGDRAYVYNVLYDDIRVEEPIVKDVFLDFKDNPVRDINNTGRKPGNTGSLGRLFELNIRKNNYSRDTIRGYIENVTYKNIKYNSDHKPGSSFEGFDENHLIKNISFENVYINGTKVTDELTGDFIVRNFVRDLTFK
jgi:hypothetical protein